MKYHRHNGTFQFWEANFNRNGQWIGKIYHDVILLKKFLQTKPQVKSMNIEYYDLY